MGHTVAGPIDQRGNECAPLEVRLLPEFSFARCRRIGFVCGHQPANAFHRLAGRAGEEAVIFGKNVGRDRFPKRRGIGTEQTCAAHEHPGGVHAERPLGIFAGQPVQHLVAVADLHHGVVTGSGASEVAVLGHRAGTTGDLATGSDSRLQDLKGTDRACGSRIDFLAVARDLGETGLEVLDEGGKRRIVETRRNHVTIRLEKGIPGLVGCLARRRALVRGSPAFGRNEDSELATGSRDALQQNRVLGSRPLLVGFVGQPAPERDRGGERHDRQDCKGLANGKALYE